MFTLGKYLLDDYGELPLPSPDWITKPKRMCICVAKIISMKASHRPELTCPKPVQTKQGDHQGSQGIVLTAQKAHKLMAPFASQRFAPRSGR